MAISISTIAVNNEAKTASVTGSTNDPNGTQHTWEIRSLPGGTAVKSGTLTISGTPWVVASGILSDGNFVFAISSVVPEKTSEFSIGDPE